MMLRWPRKCCSARVSTPSFANLNPQAWRSPADHFEEPGPCYRPTAFRIEYEATLQVLPPQLAQCPDFLAGERVRAIDTILGPPHMDVAAIQLESFPKFFLERLRVRDPYVECAYSCRLGLLRRERPRRRRAAEQRDERAPFHWPMSPVPPSERIAHLGTVDCWIYPPGRYETI